MDSARGIDTERLRRDVDATRAAIAGTVGELRQKVGETMKWQTYVERHPAPILVGAALVGLIVGRRFARRSVGNEAEWTPQRGRHRVPRSQLRALRDRQGRPARGGERLMATARLTSGSAREPRDRRNGRRCRAGDRARTGGRRRGAPGGPEPRGERPPVPRTALHDNSHRKEADVSPTKLDRRTIDELEQFLRDELARLQGTLRAVVEENRTSETPSPDRHGRPRRGDAPHRDPGGAYGPADPASRPDPGCAGSARRGTVRALPGV